MTVLAVIAVVVPLLWLGWLALIDWVPMYPLNDLRPDNHRRRLLAAAVNYPIPLLIAAGVAWQRPWSLVVAVALCVLCLAGHLVNWWLPYVGISSASLREDYQRDYARTLKLLPTEGRAVTIDAQHLVVGLLTIAMLATTLLAALQVWS